MWFENKAKVLLRSVVSFALAVVFIIRLFSTSAFRVPKLIGGHFGSEAKVLLRSVVSFALAVVFIIKL